MSLARFNTEPTGGSGALVAGEKTTADRNAYLVYIAGLSLSSRRPAAQVLGVVAGLLAPGVAPEDLPWGQLGFAHVQALKTRLSEMYHYTTANRALTAVRGVLKTAFHLNLMGAEALMRATAVKAIRGTRIPKGRTISPEELRSLFDVCDRTSPGGTRDAALLALMFIGGLRRHEVTGLDMASFDPSADTLRVVGKGNRERLVHVTNGARRALAAWLSYRGDAPGPLLCPVTKDGRIHVRRLSDQSIFNVVTKLASRAGIQKLTPHDFRRAMICTLLEKVDVAIVSRCVGHANINTTAGYDRRGERTRRMAFEQLHVPFD